MQNNNSFAVANAFKRHFARCEVNDAAEEESPDLTLHIGDLSGFVPSLELQIQWGLVPGYSLDIRYAKIACFGWSIINEWFYQHGKPDQIQSEVDLAGVGVQRQLCIEKSVGRYLTLIFNYADVAYVGLIRLRLVFIRFFPLQ